MKAGRIVIGLVVALVAFGVMGVTRLLRSGPGVPAKVLTQKWVNNQAGGGAISFDAPNALKTKSLPLSPQVRAVIKKMEVKSDQSGELFVQVLYMCLKDGKPADLEGAIQGSIAEVRNMPQTASVDVKRSDTKVGEEAAVELDCTVKRKVGGPASMHSLVAAKGSEAIQLVILYPKNQARGDEVWKRIRETVKLNWGKN